MSNVSGHNFSKAGFGPETVICVTCAYRSITVGCLKDQRMDDLKELPEGNWFCCTNCSNIHSALQKLVADVGEKLPDSLVNDINPTIVSAALVRIFGKEVAELPLVAISSDCQGQGYFGALFSCIENLVASLEVNDLVLPAADEA